MFHKILTSFAAVSLSLVCGCFASGPSGSVNTVSNEVVHANIVRIADRRVVTDPYLNAALALMEIRESVTNDKYMRVQIFFKNLTQGNYRFAYRFTWTDSNGVEIAAPDDDGWVRTFALPGDDATLTAIAPSKDCRDFKLQLKTVR